MSEVTRRGFFVRAFGAAAAAGSISGIGVAAARANGGAATGAPDDASGATEAPGSQQAPASVPVDSASFRGAVERGDLALVRSALDRDPGLLYARDERGVSVFLLAHFAGHAAITRLFLDRGLVTDLVEAAVTEDWKRVEKIGEVSPGLVNAYHPIGGTAMWAGARAGVGISIWRLYQLGGDPNLSPLGPEGTTPLRAALDCPDPARRTTTAGSLLGNGGDPNAAQRDGDSVLHAAAAIGDAYLVRLALRKGADPNARDAKGRTPLDIATEGGRREAAQILRAPQRVPLDLLHGDPASSRLAYDANGKPYSAPDLSGRPVTLRNSFVGVAHRMLPQLKTMLGKYPDLAHASSTQQELAVEAGAHMNRRDIIETLLEGGAPLALPTCLALGSLDRARFLLREEPRRIRERGAHDYPLTHYAAFSNSPDVAELLIEFGVDLESERLGITGLHFAARAGNADVAAFWLDAGADPNARTVPEGKTPLDFATTRGSNAIADLIRRKGGRRGEG